MKSELSKSEVLKLLLTWNNWMKGPRPAKNKPYEFRRWDEDMPKGLRCGFGIMLHLFLWFMSKFGLIFSIAPIAIWASKASVKYDHLWWEPVSCRLNNAYTNLGLGYLKAGNIEDAIECLKKSWRVYPCPHNTSFGIKLKLFKKLRCYPEAKDAVGEYLEMWEQFKRA